MKLIKRTTLFYREGTSDKVYEVDLCEAAPERYVVNYRYGRRGATLKEGVETPQALPLAAAEKAFDRLVGSKLKKGYSETVPDAPAGPVRSRQKPQDPAARDRKLLTRLGAQTGADIASQLSQFVRSILQPGEAEGWPLERVIWRAGELKLKAAAPLLVRLLGSGNALRDYCLIWSLGWCGDQSVIATIEQWSGNARTGDAVRHIAREAILKLAGESLARQLRAIQFDQIPEALRDTARHGPAEVFEAALANLSDQERFNILETLYTIDNAHVRPALLATLRTAPLAFGAFQPLRRIFKAAEYRRDGEVFGLLGRRFEKERATYKKPQGSWQRIAVAGQMLGRDDLKRYLQSDNTALAYSSHSRLYLRRRVWRTLERLGNLGDLDYLALASGVLLAYSDADAVEPRTSEVYDWRRGSRVVRGRWDAYAPYLNFNHVLYTHSPRYLLKPNNKAWRCRGRYQPGDPEPRAREEAFPKLWQERPALLMDLLIQSACLPVHAFAVKALAACPDYCAGLDSATIIALLGKSYETTLRFAFALAQDRYRPEDPDLDLVLALADSGLGEARLTSHRWIDEGRHHFLRNSQFLAGLVASPYPDTRAFARRLFASSLLTDEVLRPLLGRLVARLLMTTDPDLAHDIAQTLGERFESELRALGLPVVLDLLDHPLLAVQQLGARLLLGYEPEQIPTATILALLNSEHEPVRGIGVRLFGQLPQKALLLREELLIALATHSHPDLRHAIRPVLAGLAAVYPALAARLCAAFIEIVLMRQADDGLRGHLVRLLAEDIPDWSADLSLETAWKLLKHRSSAAQELGGLALARHGEWVDEFTTAQIVELANHPVLLVRVAARSMFLQVLGTRRGQPGELTVAARLLDARWEDTRAFGHEVFTVHLQAEDLTAAVLINLCDSVRPEARAFGRELIARHFKSEDGEQYLLRLSEHPEADLQLFATNYLDDAADNPERLRALVPYFVRVLSAVNRGRVAKSRLWAFLGVEAQKSEPAARIVAEILERQSLTLAAGDRARTIELMLAIHRRYPAIALPIHLQPTQLRT